MAITIEAHSRGKGNGLEPEQWIDETVLFLKRVDFIKEVSFTRLNDNELHQYVTY